MCHNTHLTPFEREKILFFLTDGKFVTKIAICWTGASRPSHGNFAAMRPLMASLCHIAPIENQPASATNRSVHSCWEGATVVGKQDKTCLVTLMDRKSRYLLDGKTWVSKTAAAVNLHIIHESAGPMKTRMGFYGSSSRRARTSRIRQKAISSGSTMNWTCALESALATKHHTRSMVLHLAWQFAPKKLIMQTIKKDFKFLIPNVIRIII